MVTSAFGFSVGDFVAVVKLLEKAAKALRETSGATSQYQQAAIELDNFHAVLTRVQAVENTTQNVDLVHKIHVCALACHIPLARFVDKFKELEPFLGRCKGSHNNGNVAAKVSRAGWKIYWATSLENEVTKLKQKLNPQFAAIDILLQLESLERNTEFRQSSQRTASQTHDCAKRLLVSLQDLKIFVADKLRDRDPGNCDELYEVVRRTQSNTFELQSKFEAVEDLLRGIEDQLIHLRPVIAVTPPRAPWTDPTTPSIGSNVTINEKQEELECIDVAVTQFFSVVSSIRRYGEQVLLMLLFLLPSVQRLFRSIQRITRSPTLLLQDNIHLEDALGRAMSLPYEHFRYWPVLFARLREAFSGLPGELRVKHNQFHIVNMQSYGNLVLTRNTWSRAVFPGSKLAMSMLFQSTELEERVCPRCQTPDIGSLSNVWIQCLECFLTYRTLKVERLGSRSSHSTIDEEQDDIMDGVEFIRSMEQVSTSRDKTTGSEMQFFKRVHLIGPLPIDLKSKNAIGGHEESASNVGRLWPGIHSQQAQQAANQRAAHAVQQGQISLQAQHAQSQAQTENSRIDFSTTGIKSSDDETNDGRSRGRENSAVDELKVDDLADTETSHNSMKEEKEDHVGEKSKSTDTLKDPTQEVTEQSSEIRKDVAPTEDAIPPDAQWTKINRRLVNPRALEEAKERFEGKPDCVVVLRVLTKFEIQRLADRTKEIRRDDQAKSATRKSKRRTLPLQPIFVDETDAVAAALKRARNTAAARKSRADKSEEREKLQGEIAELERQVNHWKSLAVRMGAGQILDD